jgi:hypothetical protein
MSQVDRLNLSQSKILAAGKWNDSFFELFENQFNPVFDETGFFYFSNKNRVSLAHGDDTVLDLITQNGNHNYENA